MGHKRQHGEKHRTSFLVAIILSGVLLAACSSGQDGKIENRTAVPLTPQISAALKNSSNLIIRVIVDKGTGNEQTFQFTDLVINGDVIDGQLEITGLSTGFHTFDLEYWLIDDNGQEILIAASSAQKPLNVGTGENNLDFVDENHALKGLTFDFDDDNDKVSNIDEINSGFNPKAPNPASPLISGSNVDSNVQISWDAIEGTESYVVYMANIAGITRENYSSLTGGMRHEVTSNNFTHPTPLVNGDDYYFIVTAVNGNGESAPSNELYLVPGTQQPPAGGVPTAPQGVTATPQNQNVTVTWQAVAGATSYTIYMDQSANVALMDPGSATWMKHANATSPWSHPGNLSNGSTYYFIVTATNASGESLASQEVSATPADSGSVPGAPQNLSAMALDGDVRLSWDPVSGADSYRVYMSTQTGISQSNFDGWPDGERFVNVSSPFQPAAVTVNPAGIVNGTSYFFVVTAFNSYGESIDSVQISATPQASPGGAPSAPQGLTATATDSNIELNWQTVAGLTYTVYMNEKPNVQTVDPNDGSLWMSHSATPPWTHPGTLTNGKTWYFIVTASDADNQESLPSSEVMATPLGNWNPQDIGPVGFPGEWAATSTGFTLTGSGKDIWDETDEFFYLYQAIKGNRELIVNVTSQTNSHAWAKAGIMHRESLDPASAQIMLINTPENGTNFQYRPPGAGALTHHQGDKKLTTYTPNWLRLLKRGSVMEAYTSDDGSKWKLFGALSGLSPADLPYFGMAVTSHDNTTTSKVTFENVRVSNASNDPFNVTAVTTKTGAAGFTGVAASGETFYKIQSLTANKAYVVRLYKMTGDLDLMVYNNDFADYQCGSFINGTTEDICVASSDASGMLDLRINGSNLSSASSDFAIALEPFTATDISADPAGTLYSINGGHRFFVYSGLTVPKKYIISLTNLTQDVDLFAYDLPANGTVCKSQNADTADEKCEARTIIDRLLIRVDGTKTTSTAQFSISKTP